MTSVVDQFRNYAEEGYAKQTLRRIRTHTNSQLNPEKKVTKNIANDSTNKIFVQVSFSKKSLIACKNDSSEQMQPVKLKRTRIQLKIYKI